MPLSSFSNGASETSGGCHPQHKSLLDRITGKDITLVPDLTIRSEDPANGIKQIKVGTLRDNDSAAVWMRPFRCTDEHRLRFDTYDTTDKTVQVHRRHIKFEADILDPVKTLALSSARSQWPTEQSRDLAYREWTLFVWQHVTGDELPGGKTTVTGKRKRDATNKQHDVGGAMDTADCSTIGERFPQQEELPAANGSSSAARKESKGGTKRKLGAKDREDLIGYGFFPDESSDEDEENGLASTPVPLPDRLTARTTARRALDRGEKYDSGLLDQDDVSDDHQLRSILKAYRLLYSQAPQPDSEVLRQAYTERKARGFRQCKQTTAWLRFERRAAGPDAQVSGDPTEYIAVARDPHCLDETRCAIGSASNQPRRISADPSSPFQLTLAEARGIVRAWIDRGEKEDDALINRVGIAKIVIVRATLADYRRRGLV